ncbi:MAG TPA: hypothetical protein P5110_02025 [Candidatus Omnitrophota bacterium]|nr:hypothetical protein [Candidatus Omnitrophota bacterium]
MMSRIPQAIGLIICLGAFFFATAGPARAQQQQQTIPPGMEVIKVGDTHVLIPRGTKVTRRGAQLILEPIDEYTARRLNDLDVSLAQLRAQTEELKKQVETLTRTIEQLQQGQSGEDKGSAADKKHSGGIGERP